ncbi:ribosomal-protein-alanine N-acetyltransferase [Vibrio aerogenes CECT 7868]|uniref:[Ribosomal protein bS18]-alanine N-acetyltransferase n=1 Tax=Vibrio aerogenes CECT 7868 TaxID=1216006 RepID=A0A1M5Y9A4_9VIBR|nr:ribosomal protein S18-alanine N-acetyltransferase [Vibrio aerogenes]SHI08660.1 ribosomal-protein-alanine N-acetyltransferase [Vibrio aerogenes CECT 7868]
MKTQIVPVESRHLARIIAIESRAHQFPWKDAMLQNLEGRGAFNFALLVNDEVIGYFYAQNIVGEVTLLNIAVDPDYQGKRYGERLMRYFLDYCEVQKAESVWLEVRESNLSAYALYLKFDFHEVDRRVGYYPARQGREDALIMSYFF